MGHGGEEEVLRYVGEWREKERGRKKETSEVCTAWLLVLESEQKVLWSNFQIRDV